MMLILVTSQRLVALFAAFVVFFVTPALAQRSWEADPSTLAAILRDAGPGDDVSLNPGEYDHVVLKDAGHGAAPLVLRSSDTTDFAIIRRLTVDGSMNVALRDLQLIHSTSGDATSNRAPFRIRDSKEITLRGLLFTRSFAGQAQNDDARSTGLRVEGSRRVSLRENTFAGLTRGAAFFDSSDIVIEDNTLHSLRQSGLLMRQVQGVRIEGNTFRDFLEQGSVEQIGTMIQFSTVDSVQPSRSVVIRDNLLTSGDGAPTQSILFRNQLVEQGKAGPDMFFKDITIEENLIINAHANGITVGPADGVLIRRNTVVQNAVSKHGGEQDVVSVPAIRLADIARDAIILGNVAHVVPEARWQTDWVVAGNFEVQNEYPTEANHYDRAFASVNPTRPARPFDFIARPGGLLDGVEVGAPRLVGISPQLATDGFAPLREDEGLFEVIRFDPSDGNLIGYGGAGAEDRLQRAVGGTIETGRGNTAFQVSVEMTAPYFEAEAFRFKLRIRPAFGSSSAGEIMRIHTNLVLGVTDRGRYRVDLATQDGRPIQMRSASTSLFSNGYANLTLEYDADTGLLTLSENGEVVGETRSHGLTRPRESWGLSFGNPFGTRKSFDGTIEAFSLEVRHPENKSWQRAETLR